MTLELELPEIETLKRDIEKEFLGRKVKAVEINSMKTFPKHRTKKDVENLLAGSKIEVVERYGMYIALGFENENYLVIKLGKSGVLTKGAKKFEGTLVASVKVTQGGDLQLSDVKNSSTMVVVHKDDLAEAVMDEKRPGFDLQAQPLSWAQFGRIVMSRELPLKLLLTDQTIFIGIGDIYSNEILFEAGLKYDRRSDQLSTQEIRRLYRATVSLLHEASKLGGTSIEKRPFFNLTGEEGLYGAQLAVYGKDGELSPRSRTEIKKTKFKNQVVYFCKTQV